jgi:maltose-binding protein MalE
MLFTGWYGRNPIVHAVIACVMYVPFVEGCSACTYDGGHWKIRSVKWAMRNIGGNLLRVLM